MSNAEKPISLNNLAESTPIPMLTTDSAGKISWVNNALTNMCELSSDQLIGFSKEDLPSVPHRVLFDTDELIHIKGVDVAECWLEPKQTLVIDDNEQAVTLYCYHDVSRYIVCRQQNAAMEETIKVLEIKDGVTGLSNQRGISLVMDLYLSRSRRYQNPFCLIKVNAALQGHSENDCELQDSVMLSISHFLRERLRWVDQISRWDDKNFVILLPETENKNADAIEKEIVNCKPLLGLKNGITIDTFNLTAATVCWEKGDDQRTMINKADAQLGL